MSLGFLFLEFYNTIQSHNTLYFHYSVDTPLLTDQFLRCVYICLHLSVPRSTHQPQQSEWWATQTTLSVAILSRFQKEIVQRLIETVNYSCTYVSPFLSKSIAPFLPNFTVTQQHCTLCSKNGMKLSWVRYGNREVKGNDFIQVNYWHYSLFFYSFKGVFHAVCILNAIKSFVSPVCPVLSLILLSPNCGD